jgi:hypothetical protein
MLFDRPSYSLRAALLGAVALAALGGVAVEIPPPPRPRKHPPFTLLPARPHLLTSSTA